MLKFYEPGEVKFTGTPMVIEVPKKNFEEFVKNYTFPLDKNSFEDKDAVYTNYIDKGLDERSKYGTMAFSIEYKDHGIKDHEDVYYVTVNYKYLHETYDDSIELKELQQK